MPEKVRQLASKLDESLDAALFDFPGKYHTPEDWEHLLGTIIGTGSTPGIVKRVFGEYYEGPEGELGVFENELKGDRELVFLTGMAIKLETKYRRIQLELEMEMQRMEELERERIQQGQPLTPAEQKHMRTLRKLKRLIYHGIILLDKKGDQLSNRIIDGSDQDPEAIQSIKEDRERMEFVPRFLYARQQIQAIVERMLILVAPYREGDESALLEEAESELTLDQRAIIEVLFGGGQSELLDEVTDKTYISGIRTNYSEQSIRDLEGIVHSLEQGMQRIRGKIQEWKETVRFLERRFIRGPGVKYDHDDEYGKSTEWALRKSPGVRWLGKLESNNGRYVGVIIPPQTDVTQPVEVVYYFHGAGRGIATELPNSYDYTNIEDHEPKMYTATMIDEIMKVSEQQGRNIVFVIPDGQTKLADRQYKNWMNGRDGNMGALQRDVEHMLGSGAFGARMRVGERTVMGHSAGVHAILNGIGSMKKTRRVVLFDGTYGNWGDQIHQRLIGSGSGRDTEMVVIYNVASREENGTAHNAERLINKPRVTVVSSQEPHDLIPVKHFDTPFILSK